MRSDGPDCSDGAHNPKVGGSKSNWFCDFSQLMVTAVDGLGLPPEFDHLSGTVGFVGVGGPPRRIEAIP